MLTDASWHAWLSRAPLLVQIYMSLNKPQPQAEDTFKDSHARTSLLGDLYQLSSLSPAVGFFFLWKAARPQAQELAEHRLKPRLCTTRPLFTTWYVRGAISGWLGRLTSTSPTKPPGCCTCEHAQGSCHPQGSTAIWSCRKVPGCHNHSFSSVACTSACIICRMHACLTLALSGLRQRSPELLESLPCFVKNNS